MFIKYSEGKMGSVIEEEDLTEEQKKTAKSLAKKSNEEVDANKSEDTSCSSN